AVGIINNSILNLEKDSDASEFFVIMFKALSAEIMIYTKSNIERAMFCAEQSLETSVKCKLNIYLTQFADMLLFIYNSVCSSKQPPQVLQTFKQKAEYVKQTMAKHLSDKK